MSSEHFERWQEEQEEAEAAEWAASPQGQAATPKLMYNAVSSIFKEYGQACPGHKVGSHDFRRRAITLTAMALGGDLEAVARAIPVTPDTARKHYFDARRAYDAAAIQKQMADVLIPKREGGAQAAS